jgi:hypothetical protein
VTVWPEQSEPIVDILQEPETAPPLTVIVLSLMPTISPPEYRMLQAPPEASIWKKSAALQSPL